MISKKLLSIFGRLRRGRLILLFVLCVLLPTIPLAYLTVRSVVVKETEDIGKKIEGHLERFGLALKKMATAGLAGCETDLDERICADQPLNEIVEEISEAVEACPVFKSFFILDHRLLPLFPFGTAGEKVPSAGIASASDRENDKFFQAMKDGSRKEFGSNDPVGAVADYKRALDIGEATECRALADNAVARCFFKMGKYREAQKYYREIMRKREAIVFCGGLSLKLLPLYQLAVIDRILGYESSAAERLLDIMRALAGGELAGNVHEAVFYASMVDGEMDKLLGSERLLRRYGPEYEDLLGLWLDRKRSAQEMGALGAAARFDFQRLLGEDGKSAQEFRPVSIVIDGEEVLLLCSALAASDTGRRIVIAVVLDKAALSREVRDVLEEMVESEGDVNVTVLDPTGDVVAAAGDAASSSGYEKTETLAPALPSWAVRISYKKQGLLFEVASKERMTRLTSIFFLAVVVFLGIYMIHRSIKRDTELARLKSHFVSRVSHELRTPLATIRAVGEMLEMGAVSSREKEQEYFRLIASESERLSRLIDNVLDFSMIGAARKTYNFGSTAIGETILNTVRAFRQYVRSEGFDIVYRTDEDIPSLEIDADAISQALINLLDNAVKFSREEKTVWVELRRKEGNITISVKDRGIGIAPEDIDRIFDQFYRPKETAKLSGKGAGIGLAIVKHVAEAHGGEVRVQSRRDEGSVFTIVLPIRRRPEI
ncbi:MAG: HAMP domain-containing sensor histidine kinase [Candidatus Tritonobacter lacicola]|nr:HAMP domain-containing sensor histidine kinase [Candidatus Tritonobacter lacicola]